MRLIDVDRLLENLNEQALSVDQIAPGVRGYEYIIIMKCIRTVENQPIFCDTEKLAKQIIGYCDVIPEWAMREITDIIRNGEISP